MSNVLDDSRHRNAGLDLLRALAIVLVFVYHWRVFVSPQPALGWVGAFGWVGVDLFFVLSGYLIADQLLRGLRRGQVLSVSSFWARRVLRTWPAFFVVLAVYAAWPGQLGGRDMPPLWRFATFTQNIGLQPGTVFSHAWSLCIEEQFYLLLPLAVLALQRLGGDAQVRRRRAWAWLGVLVLAAMALRAGLWLRCGSDDAGNADGYYTWVYYASWARADEFLPGVALALLRHGHPALWARVSAHGRRWLLAGLLACAAMAVALQQAYIVDDHHYGFWMTTVGYSAVAMAFALLVLAALCPGSPLQRLQVPGAAALARWSYTLCLSHKAVAHGLAPPLKAQGLAGWPLFVAVALACLVVARLLHRLVERPFLAWRARAVPSSFMMPPVAPPLRPV